MNDGDGAFGKLHARVQLDESRIVPGLDFAQEDLGQRRTVDDEFAGLHAVQIDDHHDAAHDLRPLHQTVLFKVFGLHRSVGRAEGHGAGEDLLDAAAGADRLVVQADSGVFFIGVGPFGIDRIGEGRACAGNIGGKNGSRSADDGDDEGGTQQDFGHARPLRRLNCSRGAKDAARGLRLSAGQLYDAKMTLP